MKLGVDIGGTFTDFVLIDELTGEISKWKSPSISSNFAAGVAKGLEYAVNTLKLNPQLVDAFIHGSTVATNAMLEQKWECAGLLTTQGFGDLLAMGDKYKREIYDIHYSPVEPPIAPNFIAEIEERVLGDGKVEVAVNLEEVLSASRKLLERGAKSLAICFLFSFLNPKHEHLAREKIAAEFKDVFVTASSDLIPEMGEYARLLATSINAVLGPVMGKYIAELESILKKYGIAGIKQIMKSDGGTIPFSLAKANPIHTLLSGPAAGVVGASSIAAETGYRDIITFDMGGTSTDVCLVQDGEPSITADALVSGYPIKVRTVDITTIGAGGGSIAWIDPAGGFRVGPQSAGADPGPACYARGGTKPTVTDADVVLGFINPHYFLGGRMGLDVQKAHAAINKNIAAKLGLNDYEAAWAIYRIINASMVDAVREVSVKRGLDPREFVLVAFGGAGPVHAAGVALELEIPVVMIPYYSSTLSALGLLRSNLKKEYVQSIQLPLKDLDIASLVNMANEFKTAGAEWLESQLGQENRIAFSSKADMRYGGQSYSLTVELPPFSLHGDSFKTELEKRFSEMHERFYRYKVEGAVIEILNLRVEAIGLTSFAGKGKLEYKAGTVREKTTRRVFFGPQEGFADCPVLDRNSLEAGMTVDGPAIIEQVDSTTVVPKGASIKIDDHYNMWLRW